MKILAALTLGIFVYFVNSVGLNLFFRLPPPYYWGETNGKFVEFVNKLPANSTFTLTSIGGDGRSAMDAAKIIRNKNLSVEIRGICMSSCVDILMPAFKHVEFIEKPVIALHGNPVIAYEIGFPIFRKNIPNYNKIYINNCMNATAELNKFWNEQAVNKDLLFKYMLKLKIKSVIDYNDTCPNVIFENTFWMPNSRQVSEIFGNKFSGELCTDSEECIKSNILSKTKDKLFIVDKEYN